MFNLVRWRYLLLVALAVLLISPTLFLVLAAAFLAYLAVRRVNPLAFFIRRSLDAYLKEVEELLRDLAVEGRASFVSRRGRVYILAPAKMGEGAAYAVLRSPVDVVRPYLTNPVARLLLKAKTVETLETQLYLHLVSTGLAKSVYLHAGAKSVIVEIRRPRAKTPPAYREAVGTIEAAIAAALVAAATRRQVEIEGEEEGRDKRVVVLKTG
ncbi:MAG: hypothetical protein ACK4SY_09330 [Pyrobaculum sp.]